MKENEIKTLQETKTRIKETQQLIRNSMTHHKKIAKEIQMIMKRDKKTIEFYKEKIAKLNVEKEKYETKQEIRNQLTKPQELANPNEITNLRNQILKEIADRREFEEKIKEIKEDFLMIKNEMGGLNATSQLQERYEKHIKILENRLDKANQKFNESIEYDKKLREEIDKLRKERFFFEDIYKKLEKDLEKLRKEISVNLESAYECYEKRDRNQETFENVKSEMMKKETEYAQKLSQIANDLNIRNTTKKSLEPKEKYITTNTEENLIESNLKFYAKKTKTENPEEENETQIEKLQNLQYKFQKLEEFTELSNYNVFCKKFKEMAQKNFDLFLAISLISKEAKQSEKEIKDLDNEIKSIKLIKAGQSGAEKIALLNELKSKTQKLVQKQDKYENDYKKNTDEFKQIKNNLFILYRTVECDKDVGDVNKLQMENGVSESNSAMYLAQIEKKLKTMQKFFEQNEDNVDMLENKIGNDAKNKVKNPKQVSDDMKAVFASMEISKIKTFENIKKEHKQDEIKLDSIREYSERIAKELMNNIESQNAEEKRGTDKKRKLLDK